LVCPKVTDAGLQNLKGLRQLRVLMFNHTQITDSGLEYLKGFGYLRKLWFIDTQVTDEGVKKLRQSLPHCDIWRGRDDQDLMRHMPLLSPSAANDQSGKTSAAKPADEASPASDQSATKEGAKAEKDERLKMLDALVEMLISQHDSSNGNVDLAQVCSTENELCNALLDSTNDPEKRVALLTKQLDKATSLLKSTQARFDQGVAGGTQIELLQAKSLYLGIKSKLSRERSKEKPPTPSSAAK
jgi:hypothetical protein